MKNIITFVVITCNRLFYLKNCVKSILEFVGLDDINLLIIDNNTTEVGIDEYLSSLPSEISIKRFKNRYPGELHRAMNYAILYAKRNKSKYINFIQDDYQYLYKHKDLIKWVYDVFSHRQDVLQLHTNLIWKYKAKKIGKLTPIIIGGIKWYFMHRKSPCDNGFTRLSIYEKIGLYPKGVRIHGKGFKSGESWFAKKCHGYRRMLLSEPNMAMIVDCAFVRGNRRIGEYFPPINEYYLKPFDRDDIAKIVLKSNNNKLSFIEDLIITDGWKPTKIRKHSKSKSFSKL